MPNSISLKSLVLTSILFVPSCTNAQEGPDDFYEQGYYLNFPMHCYSKEYFFNEVLPKSAFPIIEFMPPEERWNDTTVPSYIIADDSGRYFITMPSDDPDDICIAQTGVITKWYDTILEFFGMSTI